MDNLKKTPYLFILLILVFFPFSSANGEWETSFNELIVNDFSTKTSIGDFPNGWKTYPFQKGKAKQVYKVEEENGKHFIRAYDDKDISMPIFKDFPWPLTQYPILKWSWRPLTLPKGAKEDSRATNDSACGMYVAFGKTSGTALKYVWSSTLPVGHVWEKDPGKFFVIVLASGEKNLNRWQNEKIDVIADYKKYFGKEPKKDPSGIAIMTDGNATHSAAGCDYADFSISKNP
jgi:hypothetical protein